ncbi:uncharacterized protein [Antedon mediterranea]
MTFYIKPPSGTTHLENLETCVLKRMRFLLHVDDCDSEENDYHNSSSNKLTQCKDDGHGDDASISVLLGSASLRSFQELLRKEENVSYSDCLIEGSRKDRISHFTLRLACSMDQELQQFFMTAEKKLFHFRFSSMNAEELASFLRSTQKFLSRLLRRSHEVVSEGKFSFLLQSLHDILLKIYNVGDSWEDVTQKYVEGNTEKTVQVPFQCALDLIAQRNVELHAGIASIPIAKLDTIMTGLFEKVLWHGMLHSQRALDRVLVDERMEDLFNKACEMFSSVRTNYSYIFRRRNTLRMNLRDVDKNVEIFPLCMSHLHYTLRRKHRLRHFSRIQYTLFLKDAGVSVNDAIRFWKAEYCRPDHGKDGERRRSSHSWSKDAKRYTYSIRHLYGLEGSRINYRSHTCTSIQKMSLGHGEEGGCPYKHFDKWSLATALTCDQLQPKAAADILLSAKNHCYSDACLKHRVAKLAKFVTDEAFPCCNLESESWTKLDSSSVSAGDNCLGKEQTTSAKFQEDLQIKREVLKQYTLFPTKRPLFSNKVKYEKNETKKGAPAISLQEQTSSAENKFQEDLQIREVLEQHPHLSTKRPLFSKKVKYERDSELKKGLTEISLQEQTSHVEDMQIKREVPEEESTKNPLFLRKVKIIERDSKLEKGEPTISLQDQTFSVQNEIQDGFKIKREVFEEHSSLSTKLPLFSKMSSMKEKCNKIKNDVSFGETDVLTPIAKEKLLYKKDNDLKDVFVQFYKPVAKPIDYHTSYQNLLNGLREKNEKLNQ